jgi:predicted O-linked N-acetylglucosamine transferase (SPINDLY family)
MKCFLFTICIVISCILVRLDSKNVKELPITANVNEIRRYLDELSQQGRIIDIISYMQKVEKHYGTLKLDENMPSLYSFLGVSLYSAKRLDEAIATFKKGLAIFPNETRAWLNLGEIQVQKFLLNEAEESFTKGFRLGEYAALPRIIRTKGWSLSWENFETFCADLERFAATCLIDIKSCVIDSNSGFEYTDASPLAFKLLTSGSPNAQTALNPIPSHKRAPIWRKPGHRLKIGFVSSDFGIHPVVTLIRGFLESLDKNRFEVYCFSLQNVMSWWGSNISTTVEHFYILESKNLHEAAEFIADFQTEILLDLNGHTMFSGLPILSFHPAPLQISFLGLPTTTGSPFIDFYLSDYVTIPPEHSPHFSESLLLMQPCYIANDYAQVQGGVGITTLYNRAERDILTESIDFSKASILLASLSNSQKMDPVIFHVWMNIMNRFAGSNMILVEYAGHEVYKSHLQKRAKIFGIQSHRLVHIPQHPWIDHLYAKTAIDLVLDTPSKNAHTTGLDGIWAGIPTITLAGGNNAGSRAGESIATALGSPLGLTYSLKDYEDLAFSMLRRKKKKPISRNAEVQNSLSVVVPPLFSTPKQLKPYTLPSFIKQYPLLYTWRKSIYSKRLTSSLFNTKRWTLSFEYFMFACWESISLQKYYSTIKSINPKKKYHFFTPMSQPYLPEKLDNRTLISLDQVYQDDAQFLPKDVVYQLKNQQNQSLLLSYSDKESMIERTKTVSKKGANKLPSDDGQVEEESGYCIDKEDTPKPKKRKSRYNALPSHVFDGRNIMLNIGNMDHFNVVVLIDRFVFYARWSTQCGRMAEC